MAYNTQGEGHHGALLDESNFADWLNSGGHELIPWPKNEVFDKAEQAGGPKKIEDVVAIMKSGKKVTFSNKQAGKGISDHSHTWKNESRIFTRLQKEDSNITKPFSKVKEFVKNEIKVVPYFNNRRIHREAYNAMMKAANTQVRDNLNQALIEQIFKVGFDHISGGANFMVITDVKEKEYNIFECSKHPVASAQASGYKIDYRRKKSSTKLPSIEDIIPKNREVIIEEYGLRVGRKVSLEKSAQIPDNLHGESGTITKIDGNAITVEAKNETLEVDISEWKTPLKASGNLGKESGKIFLHKKKKWFEFWKKDEVIDAGLQLRVKHNNGVSDLFKQGYPAEKQQKNAGGGAFVSTIQQNPGSVETLLDKIEEQGNLIKIKYATTD